MTETNQSTTQLNNDQSKAVRSFSVLSILLVSFTLLAIIPLMLLMVISYPNIKHGFEASIKSELIQSSKIRKQSIEQWFNELTDSVEFEANTETTHNNINELNKAYQLDGGSLSDFVASKNWREFTDRYYDYYMHFSSMNTDFYDIFIINTQGDILYTLANESDLGTNLIDGSYSNTLFAGTFKKVVQQGRSHFSDLEYYPPSLGVVSGFIISPILDENHSAIGAFALQVNFETAIDLFSQSQHDSLATYLVNEDLLLRSNKEGVGEDEQLMTSIKNELTLRWQEGESNELEVFNYENENSQQVLGVFNVLDLIDKKWALFYEVDESDAFQEIHKLKKSLVIVFVFCLFLIVIISYLVALKISKPIKKISELTKSVRLSEVKKMDVNQGYKETNILASNFNNMILQQKLFESELEVSKQLAVESLDELENLHYAMNQHSIISITDVKGKIVDVNKKFEQISGYKKEELVGNTHSLINSKYHEKTFWIELYKRISSGKTWHGEVRNECKNGDYYWVQSTIVPIKDRQGKINRYISIRTNITARKEFELELFKTKELAEAAVIAKSEFLASMSHEIRTPMNGVLGMLNLLQKTKLDDDQEYKVDLAKNSATSLLTIIDDILDFSKIEAGKLDVQNVPFNLLSILSDVVESSYLSTQSKDLDIILDYSQVPQDMFVGDASRIKQILFNLVGNAIKFTKDGVVKVTAQVQAINKFEYKFICTITDTGIGISKSKLDVLFEKFTQADNSTTREYGGTGLGLAIVKQLTLLMRGDISVESEMGLGSKFCFHIILGGERKADFDSIMINRYKSATILMVIKNENERLNAQKQFSRFGVTIDSMDALEHDQIFRSDKHYDLILVDEVFINCNHDCLILNEHAVDIGSKLVVIKYKINKNIGFSQNIQRPISFRGIKYCLEIILNNEVNEAEIEYFEEKELNDYVKKILLVEDNFVNQQVALSLLEQMNCEVDLAENGQLALDILKEKSNRYDLVLMDCQMPVMDGYKATRHIRTGSAGEHNANIIIVALTANAMKGDKEKCIEVGMNDYLAKPIEENKLISLLNKYVPLHKEK